MEKIDELYEKQKDLLNDLKKSMEEARKFSDNTVKILKTNLNKNKNSAEHQIDNLIKEMETNINELVSSIKKEIGKSFDINKKLIEDQERTALEHIRNYRKQCDSEVQNK